MKLRSENIFCWKGEEGGQKTKKTAQRGAASFVPLDSESNLKAIA